MQALFDPTDLVGQEQDAADQQQAERTEAATRSEDLKWLLRHRPGRRIVWQLLSDTGVFRNPWDHSGSTTAFRCGQMSVGQRLLAEVMTHAPEAFTTMQKEASNG